MKIKLGNIVHVNSNRIYILVEKMYNRMTTINKLWLIGTRVNIQKSLLTTSMNGRLKKLNLDYYLELCTTWLIILLQAFKVWKTEINKYKCTKDYKLQRITQIKIVFINALYRVTIAPRLISNGFSPIGSTTVWRGGEKKNKRTVLLSHSRILVKRLPSSLIRWRSTHNLLTPREKHGAKTGCKTFTLLRF